jgi:hypothetical protein
MPSIARNRSSLMAFTINSCLYEYIGWITIGVQVLEMPLGNRSRSEIVGWSVFYAATSAAPAKEIGN